MLLFPNAKINLGLHVLRRRADGYHDIESVMLPIKWCDILEIVPAGDTFGCVELLVSGASLQNCPLDKNLVVKAYRALERYCGKLPSVKIYLRKVIPDGAGLGGGSSDAAFTIIGMNEVFELGLSKEIMAQVASEIGADCPFFIYNRPMLATGTGTTLVPIDISLDGVAAIAVVKPRVVSVSTAQAYAGISPCERLPENGIAANVLSGWRDAAASGVLVNDFENSVIPLCPEIGVVKESLLKSGALYVSMSGSGAAVYAFFESVKLAESAVANMANYDTFVSLVD